MAQMTPQQALDLGRRHHEAGRLSEAESLYRQILAGQPNHPEALHLLGVAAYQRGQHAEAVQWIRRAIAADPQCCDYHNNLGLALVAGGQLDQGVAAYRQALALQENFPAAWHNLGIALHLQGRRGEAIAAYRRVIALRSQDADAQNNLGNVLSEDGQHEAAIAALRVALSLRPDCPDITFNLAVVLQNAGQTDQAIATYRRAIALRPNWAEAINNLGNALRLTGRLDESIGTLRDAIAAQSDFVPAYNNLAAALKQMGDPDQALDCLQRALAMRSDQPAMHSNFVLMIHYSQRYDAAAIRRELQRWDQQHAQPLRGLIPRHDNDRSNDRRLRVGYVSPDFRDHIMGWNLLPLLREHDHEAVEVFCYANIAAADGFTQQFRAVADHWRHITGVGDDAAAAMVLADRIDILVDLSGHTARNRLLLFARKPAPVQVTFGGYPGGTGLATMDYHLTDPYLDPPGMTESHYVEKLIRTLDSFWCYDEQGMRVSEIPQVGPLPALACGFVTFGCINDLGKISDRTLDLWSAVLAAVPQARMLLCSPAGQARRRMVDRFGQRGIDSRRIEFVPYQPRQLYFQTYHRIDLGLDMLPYNCHTTGLDSLWMGVPTVTRVGETAVGRAGFSQLCNLQLQELAGHTDQQFVQIAASLANDLPRLAELRRGLRDRMRQSPLTDAKRFARSVERGYRQMWRNWCDGDARRSSTG